MPKLERIIEDEGIENFLEKRNLLDQYQKAKKYILEGLNKTTDFRERRPKGSNIWYFRINKQFRAWGSFDDDGVLRIFKIDDHS